MVAYRGYQLDLLSQLIIQVWYTTRTYLGLFGESGNDPDRPHGIETDSSGWCSSNYSVLLIVYLSKTCEEPMPAVSRTRDLYPKRDLKPRLGQPQFVKRPPE